MTDENDPEPPDNSWRASYRSGRAQAHDPNGGEGGRQAEAKSRRPFVWIGLIAAVVAAIFLAMWVAGVGLFSGGSNIAATTTTTTTTAVTTTTTTPSPTILAFNPAVSVESKAYFVSLWKSIRAAQIQIKAQQRVVGSAPTVSNQTDLVGLQQNCTTVVATYNAAAVAIVSKAFRSAGLPPQISPDVCTPSLKK